MLQPNSNRNHITLTIKDSYKLISIPLREFGDCFKLDVPKEGMPYIIHTYESFSNGSASIQSALVILNDSGKQQFLNNVEQWNCGIDNQMFGLNKYSSIYCKMDCEVLMDGYEVFRPWILEHTGFYIDHYITIQSLASELMLQSGCCNNVFQISGALQQYIARAVVGGRCMTAKNKMFHVKKKIADFDACSLYPSAMYQMGGFLEGLPKALRNTSYEFSKQQDGYFIRND